MTNVTGNISAAAATNDIRGAKPPVDVPNHWIWLWWGLAVLLLVVAYLAWRHWRARQPLVTAPVVPPHVRAKQKLADALRFISDAKVFCTLVADTVRHYLEERFSLHAPERTTEEFLVELQGSQHLLPDQKQTLGQFLQSCDLVKFARFEPTEAALRELHESALRLVDETQFDPIGQNPPGALPPPGSTAPPPPAAPQPTLQASVARDD